MIGHVVFRRTPPRVSIGRSPGFKKSFAIEIRLSEHIVFAEAVQNPSGRNFFGKGHVCI